MIKSLINFLFKYPARKFYELGRHETYKYDVKRNEQDNFRKALIHPSANVTIEASLKNFTNDKRNLVIGRYSLVRAELLIFNFSGKIEVGDYCFIGPGTRVWSCASVRIGNRVLISHDVNIHDNNSHNLDASERHKDFVYMLEHNGILRDNDIGSAPIVIEDDAWIGFGSVILKGVKIGKGAVVAAGSVVTKDVPPYTLVAGNPARIKKQFNITFDKL